MRGLCLSFSHQSAILLVGLLVPSTHLLWAQRTLPPVKIAIQLLDTPAPFAGVSEAQTRLHLAYRELPLKFEQSQNRTDSPIYHRLPVDTDAALSLTRTAEFIGNPPSRWLTFAPTYGSVHRETTYSVENLEHLAGNIPWVGPIILRIGQQAKAHPHFTRLLKVIKPRF